MTPVTADAITQKARDAGALSPDKEAVEVTITVPGHKTVRVTSLVDLEVDGTQGAAKTALEEAIHATSDSDLWHAARKTAAA